MANRFKVILKPVLVVHASISASVMLIFSTAEIIRFYMYTNINSVEPRLLDIFGNLPSDLDVLGSWRIDQGIAMLLIGTTCFAFTLILLLERMKLEKVRLEPLDCFASVVVFLFSAWLADKELSLIGFLFKDFDVAFRVIVSMGYLFILWLFVSLVIIFGLLRDIGMSEEGMRLKIDSILLVAGASAVFFTFISAIVHFLLR